MTAAQIEAARAAGAQAAHKRGAISDPMIRTRIVGILRARPSDATRPPEGGRIRTARPTLTATREKINANITATR